MVKLMETVVKCRIVTLILLCAALAVAAPQALALSRLLGEPELFFPQGYDQKKVASMHGVLQDKQFRFLTGHTSFWPAMEPKDLSYPTFLDYDGDTKSLETFLDKLAKLKGVNVKLSFSRKMERGSWRVTYSHSAPDTLSVAVNLKAESIDLEELQVPEWEKRH